MINEITPLLDWRGLPLDMTTLTALAMGLGCYKCGQTELARDGRIKAGKPRYCRPSLSG